MSTAVSARGPRSCATRGAAPLRPCRTLTTGRITDIHQARLASASAPESTR